MTLRTNHLEYAFTSNDNPLAAGTRFDFTAITLTIPENVSRTFRSVIIQVTCRGTETTPTTLTSWLLGIKLGAVAFNDVTVSDAITNSGEQQVFHFNRDVTSYFNTNFGSAATQTCQVGVNFGALGVTSITAKLLITYEYDDVTQVTRAKTVRIPLESPTGALTTTLTEIGTNQVPNLNSFLPEATKSYKCVWFEISVNEGVTTGTADATLNLALDSEAAAPDGIHENGLSSACFYQYIWVRNDMTTSVTHAFKAATSNTAMPFNHLCVVLCVTYTYDHTASTTIINSLMLPWSTVVPGGPLAADAGKIRVPIYIAEPATITLVQSAVFWGFTTIGEVTSPVLAIGAQANRTYTNAGTVICGMMALMQRIDSGSAQGAALTLARGLNNIDIKPHTTDATERGFASSGFVYLNYTSGKSSAGAAVHNHTICQSLMDTAADATVRDSSSLAFIIPEANRFVNAFGIEVPINAIDVIRCYTVQAERLANEGPGDGWEDIASYVMESDPEGGVYLWRASASRSFARSNTESDTNRLGIASARKWRIAGTQPVGKMSMRLWLTYHSITFNVTGSVSGSDGTTVTINLSNRDSDGVFAAGEKLSSTTRVGDGAFTIPWFDDTSQKFIEAKDSTRFGRSADAVS